MCPNGTTSNGILAPGSATVCQACVPGKESSGDRLQCTECDNVGAEYFSTNGQTGQRCDNARGVSPTEPTGTIPNDANTACVSCAANSIGNDGVCAWAYVPSSSAPTPRCRQTLVRRTRRSAISTIFVQEAAIGLRGGPEELYQQSTLEHTMRPPRWIQLHWWLLMTRCQTVCSVPPQAAV